MSDLEVLNDSSNKFKDSLADFKNGKLDIGSLSPVEQKQLQESMEKFAKVASKLDPAGLQKKIENIQENIDDVSNTKQDIDNINAESENDALSAQVWVGIHAATAAVKTAIGVTERIPGMGRHAKALSAAMSVGEAVGGAGYAIHESMSKNSKGQQSQQSQQSQQQASDEEFVYKKTDGDGIKHYILEKKMAEGDEAVNVNSGRSPNVGKPTYEALKTITNVDKAIGNYEAVRDGLGKYTPKPGTVGEELPMVLQPVNTLKEGRDLMRYKKEFHEAGNKGERTKQLSSALRALEKTQKTFKATAGTVEFAGKMVNNKTLAEIGKKFGNDIDVSGMGAIEGVAEMVEDLDRYNKLGADQKRLRKIHQNTQNMADMHLERMRKAKQKRIFLQKQRQLYDDNNFNSLLGRLKAEERMRNLK